MRFDHLMKKAQRLHRLCCKHLNLVAEHTRLARRHAFHFASTMMTIEAEWHNEFLDFVMEEKFDIDAWLDEAFMPIEQVFNQDRRVLYANIRAGMALKEYVKQGDLWTPKKDRITAVRVNGTRTRLPDATFASPIEEAAHWKAEAESLLGRVHELERRERALCAELDLVKRRVANLTKVFKSGSTKTKAQ